ncbi:MAG: hypothetical protein NC187_08025 [Candidatus Amulumruptor caecigallinarius]|nr:hypothetical protein [Candidatus Amulumruptor caecigallinarius]MCM1397417.1 hypothetical protein [Candidatus Amulumruptor caecigallinarius]MCM1454376.1 hypothetical protein [bacterium]
MVIHRYQIKTAETFSTFIDWLNENNFGFTAQCDYAPSVGDHVYHITVALDDDDVSETHMDTIDNYAVNVLGDVRVENVTGLYHVPEQALEDPYADAISLRMMLDISVKRLAGIEKTRDNEKADWIAQLEMAKDDKQFYQDSYYREVAKTNRIKEQVRAMVLMLDSIFPKD